MPAYSIVICCIESLYHFNRCFLLLFRIYDIPYQNIIDHLPVKVIIPASSSHFGCCRRGFRFKGK